MNGTHLERCPRAQGKSLPMATEVADGNNTSQLLSCKAVPPPVNQSNSRPEVPPLDIGPPRVVVMAEVVTWPVHVSSCLSWSPGKVTSLRE